MIDCIRSKVIVNNIIYIPYYIKKKKNYNDFQQLWCHLLYFLYFDNATNND